MPSSYFTEIALRAAVNTNKRTLTRELGLAQAIKESALKRSQELVQANNAISPLDVQKDAQALAINLAVKGLVLAHVAIAKQMEVLNEQRLSFDKERQAGIATFMVPTNKEESNLSTEEKVIKGFIELTFKNPSFSSYLGIHTAEDLTDQGAKFYSILPFYRMSEALGQPVSSTKPLDRQRTAINLFFKSALPDAIADIDNSFQTDCKFIAFWESAFQKKNYLNNRRAPRFIMMSLSNLLWNLQHPVDPATGFPLALNRCIEMCREAELFLNNLLNTESPPYLQDISNNENGLMSFMRKLEIYTKMLRAAYAEEQLSALNIDEVTNSAHRILRIMDQNVFKLIYKRYNPITQKKEPDERAAEHIAYLVSYLNQLLIRNGDLINAFQPCPQWIPHTSGMNVPPQTIVDVLIIFCHLSWRERDHLLDKIAKSNLASALEFAQTLKTFDRKYIKPMKNVCKEELHATIFTPKHQEVSCLTARRLVPLLCLVLKDYRVDVDSAMIYGQEKHSEESQVTMKIWSGKQQLQAINKSAEKGTGYYHWSLSPFLHMSKEIAAEINELPKQQYRMTQMTELLDEISELIQNYRSFLQNKLFQMFLLKCLNKMKEEYAALDRHIDKVDSHLAHDERMSRNMQAILRPMTRDLSNSLNAFSLAMANVERVLSAPDFPDQQRRLLATKLHSIAAQFSSLFAEDSGITALIDTAPTTTIEKKVVLPNSIVYAKKIIALKNMIQRCYDALSYQSRDGQKGSLLRELLTLIANKPHITDDQIKHIIMELTRITASYRETWVFHAAYGQTRSAQALIKAIKDPDLNSVLPLASIIFDKPTMNMKNISDEKILLHLKSLREYHLWQKSSSKLQLIPFSD